LSLLKSRAPNAPLPVLAVSVVVRIEAGVPSDDSSGL
jgi:hypothetical protein